MNPIDVIRVKLGEFADVWLYRRAKETGAHEVETWLWHRVSEVESMRVEQLEEVTGVTGKVGTES